MKRGYQADGGAIYRFSTFHWYYAEAAGTWPGTVAKRWRDFTASAEIPGRSSASVAMPVMQIGPVFVLVFEGGMLVRVHVGRLRRDPVVSVLMVAIAVLMAVLVGHGLVAVGVGMLLAEEYSE